MKKIFFLTVFILFSMTFLGQTNSEEYKEELNDLQNAALTKGQTKTEEFKEVIETKISKGQMWINLKKWVSTTFVNYKYVVDMEDKVAGIMIIKWNTKLPIIPNTYSMSKGYLGLSMESSITVEVKENKYRYTIPFGSVSPSMTNIPTRELNLTGAGGLDMMEKELTLLEKISNNYYSGSVTWNLDDRYNAILKDYTANGPSKDLQFLRVLKENYNAEILKVRGSLIKSIVFIDDF